MESTGVFWQPVYNVLKARGLTLLVVNTQHVKAVPGRKTDVKDAAWLCDTTCCGAVAFPQRTSAFRIFDG